MTDIPRPDKPLRVALIGTGRRAQWVYKPLFRTLAPWLRLVAVCDPVKENADRMAAALDVRSYYDIHALVRDKPMEAAIVVTPIPSHHSISVYLSSNGVHNLCETTWCSMLWQGHDMVATAKRNGVVIRVAENFYRYPIDRFAQALRDDGYIGPIKRIFSYNDHTGYHTNSRWIVFSGEHPLWVQALEHSMPTLPVQYNPVRFYDQETMKARWFMFPDNLLVMDQMANQKSQLGRLPRPGYTEWQGSRGTLAHWPDFSTQERDYYKYFDEHGGVSDGLPELGTNTEIRYMSDASRDSHGVYHGGRADHVSRVRNAYDAVTGCWQRTYAHTEKGVIEYTNPYQLLDPCEVGPPEYGSCVVNHIIDFVLAVRGVWESEFDDQDALMSLMMEMGARESSLQEGRRVALPLEGTLEADEVERKVQEKDFGVDPRDVEGMLALSYPQP